MPNRSEMSEWDREQRRDTWRQILPPTVVLVIVNGVQEAFDLDADEHPWHLAVGLLPLLPGLWLAWAVWRIIGRADEMQRVVHHQALAAGFVTMVIVSGIGGMLESSGLDVGRAALQWTYITGMLAWGITLGVRSRTRQ